MQVEIIANPPSWQGGDVVSVSFNVRLKSDLGVLLWERNVSESRNISSPTWAEDLKASCTAQAQQIINDFKRVIAEVLVKYPTATTQQEAANQMAAAIQAGVVI